MNPGPIEAGERVATGFIAVMKGEPLSLALCLMNLVLLLLFFYIAKVATDNRRFEFQTLQENQKEVNKLLFNCVPADRERRGDFKLEGDHVLHGLLKPECLGCRNITWS